MHYKDKCCRFEVGKRADREKSLRLMKNPAYNFDLVRDPRDGDEQKFGRSRDLLTTEARQFVTASKLFVKVSINTHLVHQFAQFAQVFFFFIFLLKNIYF